MGSKGERQAGLALERGRWTGNPDSGWGEKRGRRKRKEGGEDSMTEYMRKFIGKKGKEKMKYYNIILKFKEILLKINV